MALILDITPSFFASIRPYRATSLDLASTPIEGFCLRLERLCLHINMHALRVTMPLRLSSHFQNHHLLNALNVRVKFARCIRQSELFLKDLVSIKQILLQNLQRKLNKS